MSCQGTITVSDVPASATKMTVLLGVYAYPNSTYKMSSSKITFKNVPIY